MAAWERGIDRLRQKLSLKMELNEFHPVRVSARARILACSLLLERWPHASAIENAWKHSFSEVAKLDLYSYPVYSECSTRDPSR